MHRLWNRKSITAEAASTTVKLSRRLAERLLGRVVAEDILRPGTDEVLIATGTLVDERMADSLEEAVRLPASAAR